MTQMNKCDEGHWYDKSQNTRCPFCGIGSDAAQPTRKYVRDEPDRDGKSAQASDDQDGKTIRYRAPGETRKTSDESGAGDPADDGKTVAVWQMSFGIDPVVGWLVCIEGANQGRDYRIHSGYNNIGRDMSSQICIAGDETIARIEHAKIFYDLKDASFHLMAGSGRSGVYVNGKVVLQPTVLSAYEILEMGYTKLVFVPLCGQRFRWESEAPPKVAAPMRARFGNSNEPSLD